MYTSEKEASISGLEAKVIAKINTNSQGSIDEGEIILGGVTPQEDRRVARRVDLCLLPLMGFAYMLQYMDKLALSQATLLGMRKDLHLHGNQYAWASAVFYFGYLVFSWPSSYLIVKFPTGKYLSATVFIWGGILMTHGATKNFAGIMTARFFLGVGEAAIAPGFGLITSMFYKRAEQPLRQGAWFMGNSIANVLGGLVAYGIGKIGTHSIEHWRLLFLILGAVTSTYSFLLFFFLPDSPTKAVFLSERDRKIAVSRTLENKTGYLDSDKFVMAQVWDALTDPQTILLFLYSFCVNLANGGLTSFSAIVIKGFGFTDLKALLIQMPLGASQIVFLILTSTVATFLPRARVGAMIFNTTFSVVGMALVYTLNDKAGRMAGLCLAVAFAANIPISLSLISSNVGGFTKRSVVSATVFIAYCIGNVVGPQFYLAKEEPHYQTGIKASLFGLALGAFFLILLLCYYVYENRRRDRVYGKVEEASLEQELSEELSQQTDRQIKTFRYVL